ncbi:MAG: hypothetical protein QOD02_4046, partial [Mycobacterium sp.]|nr:hypothetical protein [Mycobacterium sp.]
NNTAKKNNNTESNTLYLNKTLHIIYCLTGTGADTLTGLGGTGADLFAGIDPLSFLGL